MSIVKNFQIYARLAEFGDFEMVQQPELDITADDYYPPGAKIPQKLASIGKYGDIEMSRAYDPSRDAAVEDWVKKCLNGQDVGRNATFYILNDQKAVQASKTFKVKPTGSKPPGGKSGDGAIAEFTVKLCVEEQT